MSRSLPIVLLVAVLVATALIAQPERRLQMTRGFERLANRTLGPTGPPPPRTVTPPGIYALSIDGDFNLDGFIFKDGYPFLHNDGGAQYYNTAVGVDALISSTPGVPFAVSGSGNTAFGASALESNTAGYFNTASGAHALSANLAGFCNTAVGAFALTSNVNADCNTALGTFALGVNISGYGNTASGAYALASNTFGGGNTATGSGALHSNTTGSANTASGAYAQARNTTGRHNTAIGYLALYNNTSGQGNTATGFYALYENTTGSRNIAVGRQAGRSSSAGSDNVWIGSYGEDESNTLRLGEGTGTGNFQQNRAFIAGIHNAVLNGSNGHRVCVDDADQLGICSPSAARFKSQIRNMGSLSAALLDLRPVVFRYKSEVEHESRSLEFGLVAEEVAEVYPQLVRYDEEGKPLTLRYDLLTPLLLNELQKQHRQLRVQWFLFAGMMFGGVLFATRWRFGSN